MILHLTRCLNTSRVFLSDSKSVTRSVHGSKYSSNLKRGEGITNPNSESNSNLDKIASHIFLG